ncbi:hypothetical protein I2I05_14830 [Hymenobacter sp. BT683]|uniref:Uncharacterized protein n=1 Tax=Hymenobacter jeongseonensis TaxID=2791027 RepID=A0ABS0IKI3_9BACT|nr:hypothetical protein [Hymenobacter jeongseonensis]MBF9238677.1 hypothetical protein [Hymenobacter jeongseonensis]
MELPLSIEELKQELERALPDYSYYINSYLFDKVLIAKKANFSGAEIRLTKKQLKVGYCVPSTWGASFAANFGLLGVFVVRKFVKDALEPRDSVLEYLSARYSPVKKGL